MFPLRFFLSGFTDNYRALIVGTNIGGLGTLIASMASLISFKYIAKRKQESEREVFGNIYSLKYYIHDIHVNIVFFFLDKGFPGILADFLCLAGKRTIKLKALKQLIRQQVY